MESGRYTDTEKDTQTQRKTSRHTSRGNYSQTLEKEKSETYGDVAGVDEVRSPDLRIDGEFDPSVVVCGG